jgi:hypothetical protein
MEEVYKSQCLICNVQFKQKRDYDNHILTKKHNDILNGFDILKCEFCDFTSMNKQIFKNHFKDLHKEEYEKIKPEQKYLLKCECCKINFTQKRESDKHFISLKHINISLDIDKNQCLYCDYKTNRMNTLYRHVKSMHPLEYKISNVKEIEKIKINPKLIKTYKLLLTQERDLKNKIKAFNTGIQRLIKKNYKDDSSDIVEIECKKECVSKKLNEIRPKIKKMLVQTEELKDITVGLTTIKNDSIIILDENPDFEKFYNNEYDDSTESEGEKIKIKENQKFEEDIKIKQERLRDIKNKEESIDIEIEILNQQFLESKGDMTIMKKISKLEIQKNKLYELKK